MSVETITVEESWKLIRWFEGPYESLDHKERSTRNHCMILLMLDAGLRVGEVVQLCVKDLWFVAGPLKAVCIKPEISKSDHERIVPLSDRLIESTKQMYEVLWKNAPEYYREFAFYRANGRRQLSTRQVERIVRHASLESFGRAIHPHVLRHTFASRLMRTTNIRIVQELLGHKQITTTQIYTHPNGDDLTNAIKTLERSENDDN